MFNKKILLFLGLILIAFLVYKYFLNPAPVIAPKVETFSMELSINDGQSVSYQAQNGQNALDILKKDHQIETKQYDFGQSIESVDGVKARVNNKYWIYYINTVSATGAADKYLVKSGDKILWKYENLNKLLPYLIIVFAFVIRLLPHQPNFSPIGAIAIFGSMFLPIHLVITIPLIILFTSDIFLGFHSVIPWVYGPFALIAILALFLRSHLSLSNIIKTSLSASILFYLITNFGV